MRNHQNQKRILVVDDETSFTRLLKLNLEQTNDYVVRVENWPEDAFEAAREFRPDLILLDVVMPRMLGGDLAERLRADASMRMIPIVFLSAAVTRQRVQEHDGFISGFPFIAKPASAEEVIERIEQQLRKQPNCEHSAVLREFDSPARTYSIGQGSNALDHGRSVDRDMAASS